MSKIILCPGCKQKEKYFYSSGKRADYCRECEAKNTKRSRSKLSNEFKNIQAKKFRQNNLELYRKTSREYVKNRYKKDINYKIASLVRNRIKNALIKNYKSLSSLNLLGCSISFLKRYIEEKFQPGMAWDNYNLYGWHIDHIIPCVKFDLTKEEEQKKCFHYTNLQPLWAKDNWGKGSIFEGNRIYKN